METVGQLLMKIWDEKTKVCTHKVIFLYFSSVLSKQQSGKETVKKTVKKSGKKTVKKSGKKSGKKTGKKNRQKIRGKKKHSKVTKTHSQRFALKSD